MRARPLPLATGALVVAILLAIPAAAPALSGVDERSGEATYEIPLVTPPGPAGSGPRLALQYRSASAHGDAGWLGLGWALAGESRIERDPSDGVPFDYASSCGAAPCYREAFSLDGEPLVCADAGCSGKLRTRTHAGLRIQPAGLGFEVRDLDGRLRTYGASPAARIVNPRNGQTFAWLLERIEDVHGNWTAYHYDLGSSPGVAYLSRIEYAQAGSPANRSLDFQLEPRPDPGLSYRAGFRQDTDQRLARIDVRAAGGALVTAYLLGYTQSPDSSRSLLASVQRLGADEREPAAPFTDTLPPWSFAYTESARTFATGHTSFCPGSCPDLGLGSWDGFRHTAAFDTNRDGLLDAYDGHHGGESWAFAGTTDGIEAPHPLTEGSYLMTEAEALPLDGNLPEPWPAEIYGAVRDVDGDGYPDWIKLEGVLDGGMTPQLTSEIHLGGPSGFADALPFTPPPGPAAVRTGQTCAACGYGSCPFVYNLAGRSRSEISYTSGDPSSYDEHLNVTLVDMNGDRRIDWIFGTDSEYPWDCYGYPPPESDDWLVYLNEGRDATGSVAWSENHVSWPDPFDEAAERSEVDWFGAFASWRTLTLDLNADGLPDRLRATPTVPVGEYEVAYNNGAGFDPPEPFFTLGGLESPLHTRYALYGFVSTDLLDLNGDGYPDQVIAPGGVTTAWNPAFEGDLFDGWLVRAGTGRGLQSGAIRWGGTSEPAPGQPAVLRYDLAHLAGAGPEDVDSTLLDFDGDGLLDSAGAGYEVYLSEGPVPDLLQSAVTPAGGRAEFAWGSSARMTDADGLPANPGLGAARPVVDELRLAAGRPGTPDIVTRYHWAGGVLDDEGGRFQGFATVTRTLVDAPPAQGRVVSRHRTDAPCAGRLASRELFDDDALLRVETHEYQIHSGPPLSGDSWHACLLGATTHLAVEGGSGPPRRARTEWSHAADGAGVYWDVQQLRQLGEVDENHVNLASDDDRYTDFGYASGPRIPARVSQIVVRASPGGAPLSHTRIRYDGLPIGLLDVGLPTRTDRLLESPLLPGESRWVREYRSFDAHGNPSTHRGAATEDDPNGHASTRTWDPTYATFPSSIVVGADPGDPGLLTGFDYDACNAPPALGLPCRQTDPRGAEELRSYDGLGRLMERTRPAGLVERHSFELPAPGAPAETLHGVELDLGDGAPLVFETWSDGLERVFAEVSPGKQSERIHVERAYDARGRLASETDPYFAGEPEPRLRSFAYDVGNRPTVAVESDGQTRTERHYDPWGVRREIWLDPTSPAQVSEQRLDGRGRVVEVARYDDPAGLDGRRAIDAHYDAADRLTRVVDPIGNGSGSCLVEFSDCAGQASRHETRIDWDSLGRRVRVDDPDRGVDSFAFDDAGLLTRRTDAAGREQTMHRDTLQRPVTRGNSYNWYGAYGADLIYENDPSQPGYGRLISVRPGYRQATYYEIEHDAAGRVIATHQRTLGRPWLVHRYALDALGRVRTHTFPDGEEFRYVYDGLRLVRIESVALSNGGTLDVLTDADYDAAGRTTRLVLGYLDGNGPAALLERSHDPLTGRLKEMRVDGSASAEPDLLLDLDFDGLGRLTALSGAYGSTPLDGASYAYDGAGRLTGASGAVSQGYGYDALGNLVQQTADGVPDRCWRYDDPLRPRFLTGLTDCTDPVTQFAADPAGLVATRDGEPLTWNAEGRLHEAPVQPGAVYRPSSSVFHYDFAGRLTGQRIAGGLDFIFAGEDFSYDYLGRLANKSFFVNGERVATRATHYLASWTGVPAWPTVPTWPRGPLGATLLAGLALLGLTGLAAVALRSGPPAWLAGSGVATLAVGLCLLPLPSSTARAAPAMSGPSWQGTHREPLLIYGADHLGSTRVVIDAQGETVETRDYSPFGETVSHSGAFSLAHRFAGRRQDDISGLVHQGARFYAPEQSRFLSPDPGLEGFDPDGLHPFAYVRNQPTSRIDPDGHASVGVIVRAVLGRASTAGLGVAASISTNPFAHYPGLTTQEHVAVTSLSFMNLGLDVAIVAAALVAAGVVVAGAATALAIAAAVAFVALTTFFVNELARRMTPRSVTIQTEPASGSPDLASFDAGNLSSQAVTVARFRQARAGGQGGPMGKEAARSTALTYYHTGIWLNVSGL